MGCSKPPFTGVGAPHQCLLGKLAMLPSLRTDVRSILMVLLAFKGHVHIIWIALAHEKYALHDGALRFADLQLGPMSKGGMPAQAWTNVMAFACKGRVLAKLGRHEEALVAFQAAITASTKSYRLMEASAAPRRPIQKGVVP